MDLSMQHHRVAYCQQPTLRQAKLTGADFVGANLQEVHLNEADLFGLNVYCASLAGANLTVADLRRLCN